MGSIVNSNRGSAYVGIGAKQPRDWHEAQRDPGQYDNGPQYNVGDEWQNTVTKSIWQLISLAGNSTSAGALANWVQITASPSTIDTLTGDNAVLVNPIGNNINVIAGQSTLNSGATVSFQGNNSTATLTLDVTDGNNNTTIGNLAGSAVITGHENTALGAQALSLITSAGANTAIGFAAGSNLLTGIGNIIIGDDAGADLTGAENLNILVGNIGVTGESAAIRIGTQGTQTTAYMAGIYGVTPSGTNQTVTVNSVTGQLGSIAGGGSTAPKITTFNYPGGTWTIDPLTTLVEIFAWNGGGGGGSGSVAASTNNFAGGGGGASGQMYYKCFPAVFSSPVSVTVGGGGLGGAAVSTNNTFGNAGGNGGITSIPPLQIYQGSPGQGGGAGNYIASGPTSSVVGVPSLISNIGTLGTGTPGKGANLLVSKAVQNSSFNFGSTGGGAGGGYDATAGTIQPGNAGGSVTEGVNGAVYISGGIYNSADGASGGDGNPGQVSTSSIIVGATGGGGGAASALTNGGSGGNGGFPGGGGGGGGIALNGNTSGAGGNGANGYVIIIEYR